MIPSTVTNNETDEARKQVAFVADSLKSAYKFRQVLSALPIDFVAHSTARFERALDHGQHFDLVIFEFNQNVSMSMAALETALVEAGGIPTLIIAPADILEETRLPSQVKSDFVVSSASEGECSVRIRRLLWPRNDALETDTITVGSLCINLATYQVTIAGTPLDLTYLEYALLAFLAAHPGRTFSRDALLQRVWGFDYYGGSRTVDVHVRRVRSKLGPDLAHHLDTVRGVGYLWQI